MDALGTSGHPELIHVNGNAQLFTHAHIDWASCLQVKPASGKGATWATHKPEKGAPNIYVPRLQPGAFGTGSFEVGRPMCVHIRMLALSCPDLPLIALLLSFPVLLYVLTCPCP